MGAPELLLLPVRLALLLAGLLVPGAALLRALRLPLTLAGSFLASSTLLITSVIVFAILRLPVTLLTLTSDFYLMPSRFEPCGLNQMYSLRYGSIPIVRATGGLDDSVVDAAEDQERADGIKFREYSARALAKAIRKALILYEHPEVIAHCRRNGMIKDFSWERTTEAYSAVYRQIQGI